jgi:hypothetical protein
MINETRGGCCSANPIQQTIFALPVSQFSSGNILTTNKQPKRTVQHLSTGYPVPSPRFLCPHKFHAKDPKKYREKGKEKSRGD